MRQKIEITSDLFIRHGKAIEDVLRRAVRQALLEHKQAGNPIATWEDGKIVLIQPKDILVDDLPKRKT